VLTEDQETMVGVYDCLNIQAEVQENLD